MRFTFTSKASAFLLTSLLSLSASATIETIEPGTPFQDLEPSRNHSLTSQQIMQNLLRNHYAHQRLDDKMSSKVLDILLEDIDSTRSYFLASDVQEFEKYRKELDDALARSDMSPEIGRAHV